jgi:hypothetical protein
LPTFYYDVPYSVKYHASPIIVKNFYGLGVDSIEVTASKYFESDSYSGLSIGTYTLRFPLSRTGALVAGLNEYGVYRGRMPASKKPISKKPTPKPKSKRPNFKPQPTF